MNGQTHTQGPWRRVGHRTIAAGAGINGVTICELYSWGDCSEADANEALISAAPANLWMPTADAWQHNSAHATLKQEGGSTNHAERHEASILEAP